MSDHFRSIGFTLEREELESLVARAIARGTTISATHGDYHVWTPGSGAELWIATQTIDGRRQLAGANPYFVGAARLTAIVESLARDADHALEGELFAWASPIEGEHGLYPFSASVPDFDASFARCDPPFRTELALVGFAHGIAWWPSEEARAEDEASAGNQLPATSIVPLGIFANAVGRARSQAIVTGTVVATETRVNPATERVFRRVRLATYGGEIDIVAAPEIGPVTLDVGGFLSATCWLAARIIA